MTIMKNSDILKKKYCGHICYTDFLGTLENDMGYGYKPTLIAL